MEIFEKLYFLWFFIFSSDEDSAMENEAIKGEKAQEGTDTRPVRFPVRSDVTFRDDQHDFYWLLDALRISKRRKGARFRLVDSGVFDVNQLEDLVSAGADLYTSDLERKSSAELAILLKAARKSGVIVAFFILGDLPEEGEPESLSISSLSLLGKDGLIIHVSNRGKERKISDLTLMAVQCRLGSGRLVYYHHGPLTRELIALAKEGVWIHIANQSLRTEEDSLLFRDILSSAQSAGANGVLHVEKDMVPENLGDALKGGTFVLLKTLPKDYKSPLRPLEDKARKRKLDFRAFYLSPSFLP
jgi:hypothetical protein